MRSVSPLLAAGLALAVAGQAFAASPKAPPGTDQTATTPPASSSTPPSTDAAPTGPPASTPAPATTPGSTPGDTAAPAASGAGSNTSATASGAGKTTAPPSFTVGEVVKDNTGAAIGTITELKGSGDQQMAVIKMGDQSFQVQSSKMGATDGGAEINMTKAQIAGMLHTK